MYFQVQRQNMQDVSLTLSYKIQNVVSTFNGGVQRLNLRQLCMMLNWCQFNPEVFAALIGRLEDPKTTLLTFTSANNVCTGAKSEIDSRLACRMMASIMQDHGIECSMGKFVVQNIVASAYTGFPLKLEAIAVRYSPDANYDPEVFPGLIFRMRNPKIVFLAFREGKLVITGGKKRSQITKATNIFYRDVLLPFRDYSATINYVQVQPATAGTLVEVISKIVDEFGDENDADGMAEGGEEVEDFSDIQEAQRKLDFYEKLYKEQLESK
jgi:transcription initiation factor TFIID TATA-box-binding protein